MHALTAYIRRETTVARCAAKRHTQRVDGLRARSHQMLDVLSDREIILDAHARPSISRLLRARYSRQRCRFSSGRSMVSPSSVVSEVDLGRLVAVQLEVVSRSPFLHVGELCVPRRLVVGRDDDVRVVIVLAH